ncbi:DoxX family protein [Sorangium sp. So ce363]|uniref:DoxX family protein n=1 Tax=Sorangium sp. So ce363 TaxID=3133304 RepID=UPI003F5ED67A
METSALMSEQHVEPVVVSSKKVWAGRILSGLSVAFLLFDSIGKLMMVPQVLEGSEQLGYPVSSVRGIGLVLLASVVTYMIPRTSVLGAILLTGFLGGAVATHVRVDNPLFSHVLFPVYVAAMIWGGLLLRDERLRALLPLRK